MNNFIDDLTYLLEDISLDESQSNINNPEPVKVVSNTMATVDYQLLKLFLETIPSYDGNPHTLSVFINSAENLITNFPSVTNPILQNIIVRAIVGKLTGRALMLIGSRTDLQTWEEIKKVLGQSFGDQRDVDCLIQDLLILKPTKNETPYSFGMRCQDSRCLIISKLNTLNMDPTEKLIRIRSYDDLALKTFIRGLPNPVQTTVRLRNPENLEKAMGFVIEEENFLYASRQANSLNQYTYNPPPKITPNRLPPQINSLSRPIPPQNAQIFRPPHLPNTFSNNNRFPNTFQNHPRPPYFPNNGTRMPSYNPVATFREPYPNNPFSKPQPRVVDKNNFTPTPMDVSKVQRKPPTFPNKNNFGQAKYVPTPMDVSTCNSRLYTQYIDSYSHDAQCTEPPNEVYSYHPENYNSEGSVLMQQTQNDHNGSSLFDTLPTSYDLENNIQGMVEDYSYQLEAPTETVSDQSFFRTAASTLKES